MHAIANRIGEMLPLGAHLMAPRRGYTHHGIYVGAGRVVHYAGLFKMIHGLVEEVELTRFAAGQQVVVVEHPGSRFSCSEVVERARSRLGERRYELLMNNCEHFCSWCLNGQDSSPQVEKWLSAPRLMLRAVCHGPQLMTGFLQHAALSLVAPLAGPVVRYRVATK